MAAPAPKPLPSPAPAPQVRYGTPASAPSGGTYSDLPAQYQAAPAPLPPGSVRLEDVGKTRPSAQPTAGAVAPVAAPAATPKAMQTEEVQGEILGEEERDVSFEKPSRWDHY
jgi:hypothetical protein